MPDWEKALVDSLNEVVRLLEKRERKGSLTREQMRRALQNARDAVHETVTDEEMSTKLVEALPEYEEITEKKIIFEHRFIPSENSALKNAGISVSAKKILIKQARTKRTSVSFSEDYRDELPLNLKQTREDLDRLLAELSKPDPSLEGKKKVQKNWRKIVRSIGGVALVGIDASIGLAEPVTSAVSAAIGTHLMEGSLKSE